MPQALQCGYANARAARNRDERVERRLPVKRRLSGSRGRALGPRGAFDGASEHNTLDVTADELELLNALPVRHASDILLDDRPGIELLRDVVSRGADDLDAPVARAAIGVSADESRQNE